MYKPASANHLKGCHSRRQLMVAVIAAVFTNAALAADPPINTDPGAQEIIRQQERERLLRQQQETAPDVRLERPQEIDERIPEGESPCFTIQRIELTGADAGRFQWALEAAEREDDPAIGRCLGGGGINLVMRRVQNAIVARGYVTTRILAEPQDLKSGMLRLTVIPGRIRNIRFEDGGDVRGTKWNAVPASPGDLLSLRDIEQGLENFKRVPTADADIQITPAEGEGALPGESDLVIKYRQEFPFRLTATLDDGGSKATGKYQAGLTFSFDNMLTLNDLFYFSANQNISTTDPGNKGTAGHTVHYSLPFGYWSLGFTASSNRYHQKVAGANQSYIYRGTSDNSEIRLTRLLYRDGTRKTSGWLRGWMRSSNNYIDDTEIEVQRRRMAGGEVGISHREFLSSGSLDVNLAYRWGTGAMGSLPAPEEKFGEGTSRPRLVTADTQFNWQFAVGQQKLRYTGVLRGQWNDTPLVPQDRFSIGGRYTVRGFDGESVLSAERGLLVRNDLGMPLGASGQEIYLGADYGEVDGPSSTYLVGKYLVGAVVGLRGGYRNVSYDVFVGQPIKRPEHFKTASTTAGFFLSLQF